MTDQTLEAIIGRFSEAKLLVLGDLRLERVLQAGATQEAEGVLKVHGSHQKTRVGGAGTVACAVAALGARTWIAGILGQDHQSGELLRALGEAGVDSFAVVTAPGLRTGESLAVELNAESPGPWRRIEIELAPVPPLAGAPAQEMLTHISALITQVDALVMLAPDLGEEEPLQRAAEVACGHGKLLIGGHARGWLPACDLAVLAPAGVEDNADGCPPKTGSAVRELLTQSGHRAIIVPCAEQGVEVHRAGAAASECVGAQAVRDARAWDWLMACAATAAAVGADALAAGRIGAAAAAAAAAAPPAPVTPDAIRSILEQD